jgi:hypothetical protein
MRATDCPLFPVRRVNQASPAPVQSGKFRGFGEVYVRLKHRRHETTGNNKNYGDVALSQHSHGIYASNFPASPDKAPKFANWPEARKSSPLIECF